MAYDGTTVDQGDSGSPAIVFGGFGPGALPELADIGPYVLGVLSKANALVGQGNTVPPGTLQRMWYTPTFQRGHDGHGALEGGAWLDERFVDFDGDGVRDEADNCPWLANASQDDTNLVAEHVLHDGANPCPSPHAPPTASSSPECIDYFRAHYQGDACDHDAVTRATLFDASTDAPGQCQNVQATPMGGYTFGGASSCPQHVNTGVRWSSRVGSRKGYQFPQLDLKHPLI